MKLNNSGTTWCNSSPMTTLVKSLPAGSASERYQWLCYSLTDSIEVVI